MRAKIRTYEVEYVQYKNGHVKEVADFCYARDFDFLYGNKSGSIYTECGRINGGDFVVFRIDTGKLGVYSESHFNRKFEEVE